MKNFALIGAAGYIAPKHIHAIAETGNRLVVALDPHDSVGILDRFFPEASFFTEVERFDRFLERQRRDADGTPVDFVSICSPNYLHDAHARLAMRVGADAICEKPLVITPWNLDQLSEIADEYQRRVFTVLQLRMHPEVKRLKQEMAETTNGSRRDICLTYITRRGKWYHHSWKGIEEKSGGLVMNIGIHFFDFLLWIFGGVERSCVHVSQPGRLAGVLELERARVRWFLSVAERDLPENVRREGGYAYRSLTLDGEELDLSAGFTDLHTEVYRDILSGGGYGINEARPAVEVAYQIRTSTVVKPNRFAHPFLRFDSPVAAAVALAGQ